MTVFESDAGWSGEPASDEPAEPTELARYEWQDVIGRGGMGTVHAAYDRRLGREVALKQLRVTARDASREHMLRFEAWVTASLEHPAIVPVYDAGDDDCGRVYFTMRLVRGVCFADALDERPTLDARLGLLRAFLTVCEAVAYAHSRGGRAP